MGASLLALAKSIYYIFSLNRILKFAFALSFGLFIYPCEVFQS